MRGFGAYGGVSNNDPRGDIVDAFGSLGIGFGGGIGAAGVTAAVATPWLSPDHAENPGTGVFFGVAWASDSEA